MPDTHVLGIQGICYVGSPTVVLGDDQEVSLKIANTVAKRATRGAPRKSARIATQELSFDMTISKDPANASYILLQQAALLRTLIAVKFLDKSSGKGWDADWAIESWEESQPMDDWDGIKMSASFSSDNRALTEI